MTFIEFLATRDTPEDRPEDWTIWSLHWRNALPTILHGEHCGDCTESPQTCVFCWLEESLRAYRIEVMMRRAIDYMMTADGNLTVGELRQQVREKFGADVDAALAEQFGKHRENYSNLLNLSGIHDIVS